MFDDTASEEKRAFWRTMISARPPAVRFSSESRVLFSKIDRSLDHIELMMCLMEAHPLLPFEGCTFGSDLLDFRRGIAYEMVLRQLAHTRSLVANTNIRNRPGIGTAIRCMLEMYAFSTFLLEKNRIEDRALLEKLYHGRAFTPGGCYDIEREWENQHGEAMPKDAKDALKALLNLPRVGDVVKAVNDTDQAAGYVYAIYSEFVHPAFGRPREESESALGIEEMSAFGTSQYYAALYRGSESVELLGRDIKAASFCLELFWPRLMDIDPLFDDKNGEELRKRLKGQNIVAINDQKRGPADQSPFDAWSTRK